MASLTPPEGTSVNLPLDAYKASALPEGINLMQLTINGPRSTTLRDIEITIAEGKHLCFHLLKEEYDHLPSSKVHHAAGRGRGHHQRGQSGKPHQKPRRRPLKALAASFRASAHHGRNWPDIVAPIRRQIGICTSGRIIHRDCGAVHLWQLP